jgi:Gpi18-like mannosyltransferase
MGQYFSLPELIQRVTTLRLEPLGNYKYSNDRLSQKDFSIKKMMLVIVSTRVLIFIIIYLVDVFFYTRGYISFAESFKRAWFIQDSNHYVSIAQDGYTNTGDDSRFIAFYPLYPLLIRIFSYIFRDYMVSGIIISILCMVIACYFIMKLVTYEFGEIKIAKGSVKYILIFPVTFFFSIVYTESLFLMLTVMCFYFLRKKKWLYAGICSMMASLTKNQGLLLLLPMLIEMFFSSDILKNLRAGRYKRVLKAWLRYGFYLILCPIGFGIYLMVNKLVTGDWFMFLYYQRNNWGHYLRLFSDNLQSMFETIRSYGYTHVFTIGTLIPTVFFFFAALLLIMFSVRKLPLSYTFYSLAFLIVSYTPSWVISGPRYIMNIFPIYIILSVLTYERKALRYVINVACLLMLAVFTGTFLFWGTY